MLPICPCGNHSRIGSLWVVLEKRGSGLAPRNVSEQAIPVLCRETIERVCGKAPSAMRVGT